MLRHTQIFLTKPSVQVGKWAKVREELILASADSGVTKITASNTANFFIVLVSSVFFIFKLKAGARS
jgi:hypothetical protein